MSQHRNNSARAKVKARRRDPQTPGYFWLAIPLLLAVLFLLMPGADAAMRTNWVGD